MWHRVLLNHWLAIFVSTVFLAVTAVTPSECDTAEMPADRARVLALNDLAAIDGGYELRHPEHLAKFRSDGIEVSPRGSNLTWSWRLERVGPAASKISLIEDTTVQPGRPEAVVVRYDRVTLDEEYVLGVSSIEQRFILHIPPRLDGRDLVLEGRVSCNGEFRAMAQGWEWHGDDGFVWLGPAVVFDADGIVLPSRFEVNATTTRLVVDGAALAGAAYPVTIDPEIGANDFRISDMGPDGDTRFQAKHPAVAFNEMENEWLVVWAGDSDHGGLVDGELEIFGQLLGASGGEIHSNDFRISDAGGTGTGESIATRPDVAWNSTRNHYLVVWMADDPKDGAVDNELEIWGQVLGADGGGLYANDFRISRMGPDGDTDFLAADPAVTYNSTADEYLVVWKGEHHTLGLVHGEFEIWAQRVDWSGPLIGPNLRMSDMGGTGDPAFEARFPDVAYNSQDDEYLIVWGGDDNTGSLVDGEYEIYGQLIDATGAGVGPNDYRLTDIGGIGDPDFDGWHPKVAYNSTDNEFLVVWDGDDNVGGLVDGEAEVFSQRLTANLGGLGPNDYRLSDAGGIGNTEFRAIYPEVAYNASTNEYAVVWWGDDSVGGTWEGETEVYCQLLTADVVGIGPNDARVSDIGGLEDLRFGVNEWWAQLLAVGANSNNGEFLTLWSADDPVDGIVDEEFEIFGQRVIGNPPIFADGFESGDTAAWSATVP